MENKTIIKRLLFILCSLVIYQITLAQNIPDDVNCSFNIEPSPNALSAISNINADVSLYTGKLNVNIPLYTLTEHEIEVPISISYTNGGIRVDDLAGPVGLGWSLNTGGVITRQVRGLPDEYDGTFKIEGTDEYPAYGYLNERALGKADKDYFLSKNTTDGERLDILINANQSIKTFLWFKQSEVWDTEPDVYYFNFGKYSGKFLFNKEGEIKIIPHQNLRITKTITSKTIMGDSDMITSFEVTAEDGTKYIFGNNNITEPSDLNAVEETSYSNTIMGAKFRRYEYLYCNPTLNYPHRIGFFTFPANDYSIQKREYYSDIINFASTWYLKEIVSVNNNSVQFEYESFDSEYINSYIEQVLHQDLGLDNSGVGYFSFDERYTRNQNLTLLASLCQIKSKLIKKITASNGNRIFFSSSNREDLVGGKKIDEIRITDKYSNQIKLFSFSYKNIVSNNETYDYFITKKWKNSSGEIINKADTIHGLPDSWNNKAEADHRRLLLTGITEKSVNNSLPPYKFNYYYPEKMPRRFSFRQDRYGFFGHAWNGIAIPEQKIIYTGYPAPIYYSYGLITHFREPGGKILGTRRFEEENVRSCALREIHYPTGGHQEFLYEKNIDPGSQSAEKYCGGIRISDIKVYTKNEDDECLTKSYIYKDGNRVEYPRYIKEAPISAELYHLLSSKPFTSGLTQGGTIGYGEVHEIIPGQGTTIYKYTTEKDVSAMRWPTFTHKRDTLKGTLFWNQIYDNDHKRGLIKEIESLNENGDPVKKTTYHYNMNPEGFTIENVFGLNPYYMRATELDKDLFRAGFYHYEYSWFYVDKIEEEVYYPDGKKTTITKEFKIDPVYLQPIETNITQSNGNKTITKYRYPQDYSIYNEGEAPYIYDVFSFAPFLMKKKHIINQPIETTVWESNKLIAGKINKFKTNFYLQSVIPFQEYHLRINQPLDLSEYIISDNLLDVNNNIEFSIDDHYVIETEYDSIDSKGNLLQFHQRGSIPVSYQWDQDGHFLIAKIINSRYGEFSYTGFENYEPYTWDSSVNRREPGIAKTGHYSYHLQSGNILKYDQLQNSCPYILTFWAKNANVSVNNIAMRPLEGMDDNDGWQLYRSIISGANIEISGTGYIDEIRVCPENAQMETYTYNPFGITSATTSNQFTQYISYDEFGRKSYVLNQDKDVLQKVTYSLSDMSINIHSGSIEGDTNPICGTMAYYTASVAGGAPPYYYEWKLEDNSNGTETVMKEGNNQKTFSFLVQELSSTLTCKVTDSGFPSKAKTLTKSITSDYSVTADIIVSVNDKDSQGHYALSFRPNIDISCNAASIVSYEWNFDPMFASRIGNSGRGTNVFMCDYVNEGDPVNNCPNSHIVFLTLQDSNGKIFNLEKSFTIECSGNTPPQNTLSGVSLTIDGIIPPSGAYTHSVPDQYNSIYFNAVPDGGVSSNDCFFEWFFNGQKQTFNSNNAIYYIPDGIISGNIQVQVIVTCQSITKEINYNFSYLVIDDNATGGQEDPEQN